MGVREVEEEVLDPPAPEWQLGLSARSSGTRPDPRTRFPAATVDVTKHAIEQASLRWPVRFRQQSAAHIAETLLAVYRQATRVEQRKDGKWRYFYDQMWVVATLGYDQHTVVLVTCYPPRTRPVPPLARESTRHAKVSS